MHLIPPPFPFPPASPRLRKTYKEAFENEDIEGMATAGYEGYVAEGLDLGVTFDPEDNTNHRYAYVVPESDWQVRARRGRRGRRTLQVRGEKGKKDGNAGEGQGG